MNPYERSLQHLMESSRVSFNLPVSALIEKSLASKEASLAVNGALLATTGKYTGRSPHDKFIVQEASTGEKIAWGDVNKPFTQEKFEQLFQRVMAYLQNRDLYVFDGYAGADTTYRLPIRVINEFAWQNLFVHNLFIRPTAEELAEHQPEFSVIAAPGFKAIPEVDGTNSEAFIIINFEQRIVLIGGTSYAGEMKKSIFSVMNFLLPQRDVLSMHCSANMGEDGNVALFFGLSGTGKTTLSADPERHLIGDDEHGWSEQGVFNIEGGCYAKCIQLSAEKEPQIFNAIRFGSVLENVDMDPVTRQLDYDSNRYTENTRTAYPINYIDNCVIPGVGGHPTAILFLTADAFGVLPPIARLTKEQAMYHFMSGYTSKLAGTERGITEPQATFSTCFGAPFLPLDPSIYAKMLGDKMEKHQVEVFLVNTGWTGGPYGVGKRMNLAYTRAMVRAAIQGKLRNVAYETDPIFGLHIPTTCPDVPSEILQPRNTWQDKSEYDKYARMLANKFQENFKHFAHAPAAVRLAGPQFD
ncbi:phosphoenolpyruvate carboxykinase (ATP) [Rubeoparvulum massiliense]|uniref:phosphoenolpyruvate carboxykinase (ATP) n=1 Tax=Rubeoparvulum massiliense TaxID=1631346 RepID=UPI00065DECF0|nr:phosphoenolpyruvate carboxykinase (ATP) [Rubeoparvulum massiliense]